MRLIFLLEPLILVLAIIGVVLFIFREIRNK
jgi:flagellar biogenesis protein FliO